MKPGHRIEAGRPLPGEIARLANAEIACAMAALRGARTRPQQGFHQCRKRIKKLRALVKLVHFADRPGWHAVNVRFRDIARALAGPREASALIETVDRVMRDYPKQSAHGELDAIREELVERHDRHVHRSGDCATAIDVAIRDMESARMALAECRLPTDPEAAADLLAEGATHILRRARKALKHARENGEPADFHELRKAVKAHWMHVTFLARVWPGGVKKQLKRFDALGEALGDLNDDFVMLDLLGSDDLLVSGKSAKIFRKLLKRDVKSRAKQCLAEADKLFDLKPGKVARQVVARCRDACQRTPPSNFRLASP